MGHLPARHAAQARGSSSTPPPVDSAEQFEAFAPRLLPILAENGIELAGPPEIIELHNVVKR